MHHLRVKKLFVITLLASLALLAFVATRPKVQTPAGPAARWSLNIGVVDDLSCALLYLAKEKGFFRDKDIEVTLTRHARGETALKALLAGEADMAAVIDFALVNHLFVKDDVGVLCSLGWSEKAMRVVTRTDLKIRRPKDLEGKSVAVPLGSSAHHYLEVFLRYNGMSLNAVRLVDMEPEAMPQALIEARVEAIVATEPTIGRAAWRLNEAALVFDPPEMFRSYTALVLRKPNQIDAELLRATMGALLQARRFSESNADVAQLMVTRQLGQDRMAEVQRTWKEHERELSLGLEFFNALDRGARWLLDTDPTLPEAPDFQTLVLDLDARPTAATPAPAASPSPATTPAGPLAPPAATATPTSTPVAAVPQVPTVAPTSTSAPPVMVEELTLQLPTSSPAPAQASPSPR